jgi:hypothetical protein
VAEREWKPGDVAMVDSWRGNGQLAFRCERVKDEPTWCVHDGHDTRGLHDHEVTLARPALVIDIQDTEQIERLDAIYQRVLDTSPRFHGLAQVMATALREFANPTTPRPDEPTGKFAEVQNAEGMVYYRSPAGTWLRQSDNLERPWDHIDAVKVLSEGIR